MPFDLCQRRLRGSVSLQMFDPPICDRVAMAAVRKGIGRHPGRGLLPAQQGWGYGGIHVQMQHEHLWVFLGWLAASQHWR